jgi:hypothetical protein
VIGLYAADTCVWKPPGGLSEDFLYVADIELIHNSQKMFYKGKTYNLLSFHVYKCLSCNVHLSLNDYHFC